MDSVDVGSVAEADRALLQAAVTLIAAGKNSHGEALLRKHTTECELNDAIECANVLAESMRITGTNRDDVHYKLRLGYDLCDAEKAYVTKRDAHTLPSLRDLVYPSDLTKPPPTGHIAMCFSGGGYRAMIGTVAFVNACKRHGLLDCTSYIAGLSGSSWALGPWYTSQNNPFVTSVSHPNAADPWSGAAPCAAAANVNFQRAREMIQPALVPAWDDFARWKIIGAELYRKLGVTWKNNRPWNAVDIFGALLGLRLLEPEHQREALRIYSSSASMQAKIDLTAAQAHFPLPICTSVYQLKDFAWWDEEVQRWDEDRLHYLMGMWGSAFAANIHTQLTMAPNWLKWMFKKVFQFTGLRGHRLEYHTVECLAAAVRNPSFLLVPIGGAPVRSASAQHLMLRDGGLAFNLPIVPLLRQERNVHVILVGDSRRTWQTSARWSLACLAAVWSW